VRGQVARKGDTFAGGALDARREQLAETVLMFEDGRFRTAYPLRAGEVETVAIEDFPNGKQHTVRVSIPQFEFSVPGLAPASESGRDARLRFVGISEDAASELSYGINFSLRGAWPQPGVELALEERGGREGIAASSGQWILLGGTGIRGRVEIAEIAHGREVGETGIALSGWAANAVRGSAAPAALVFVAGRFVGTVEIDRPCPAEAVTLVSPDLERCGFATLLPTALLDGPSPSAIRILVPTATGAAAELDRSRTGKPAQRARSEAKPSEVD